MKKTLTFPPIPESERENCPCCMALLDKVTDVLRQCLQEGRMVELAPELQKSEGFLEIYQYIQAIQEQITFAARGQISAFASLEGHSGILLQELQANLAYVCQYANRVAKGDFSTKKGKMGEISDAFDLMSEALQKTLFTLEDQKAELAKLSLNLKREVETRVDTEKSLRLEQIRLQKLASTDPLTGIANRRYFFQVGLREIERSRRTGSKACLAMLDIDHFKKLNDSMGHRAGDRALTSIAQCISRVIRPYDLVGRYGGDEFIFIFPEASKDDVHGLLDRLRDSVEQLHIDAGENNPPLTVSIGLTEVDADIDDGDEALNQAITRADDALYRAKNLSRNHICIV